MNRIHPSIQAFFLLLCIHHQVVAQPASVAAPEFSVAQLHADFDILRSQLEKYQSGLYTHTSKVEMDQDFDELKAAIKAPMTAATFYTYIAQLHPIIKNGHTIIRPSEKFDDGVASTWPVFPLDVYWDQGQLYVLRNVSEDPDLVPGTKILSINGEVASQVFLEIAGQWTRDGDNTTFPEGITYRAFQGLYANFKGLPELFTLQVETPNGEVMNKQVQALPEDVLRVNREKRYGAIHHYWDKSQGEPITLTMKDSIAILAIKTCANADLRKLGCSIRKNFNQKFAKIEAAGIKHLIIDIRNNGGGEETTTVELLRHLVDQPFTLPDREVIKTRKLKDRLLYEEKPLWLNIFSHLATKKTSSGYTPNWFADFLYSRRGHRKQQAAKAQFKGQIYTLTNAFTFSAGGFMAGWLKHHTNSIFIGEEPGGNHTEISAGYYLNLVLPNTRNRAIIPIVHEKMLNKISYTNHGVLPDYPIRPSIQDKIKGIDTELEFTLDLIQNRNESSTSIPLVHGNGLLFLH